MASKTSSEHTDLMILLQQIRKANDAVSKAKTDTCNKDIILVLGNTEAGKSTFVNYFLGKHMVEVTDDSTGDTRIDCLNPVTKIGHGHHSETLFPVTFPTSRPRLAICDCPGLSDSNGRITDMVNTYSIAQTAKLARSLKCIILVVDYNSILSDRGKSMRSCMQTLLEIFGPSLIKNSQAVSQALLLVFNKVPTRLNVEQISRLFLSNLTPTTNTGTTNSEHGELFASILKNSHKIIANPLDGDFLSIINHLETFPGLSTKQLCLESLSTESEQVLRALLTQQMNQVLATFRNTLCAFKEMTFNSAIELLREVTCLTETFEHAVSSANTPLRSLLMQHIRDVIKLFQGLSKEDCNNQRLLSTVLDLLRRASHTEPSDSLLCELIDRQLCPEIEAKQRSIAQYIVEREAELARQRRAEEQARLERERRQRQEEEARRQREREEQERRELQERRDQEQRRQQELQRQQAAQPRCCYVQTSLGPMRMYIITEPSNNYNGNGYFQL